MELGECEQMSPQPRIADFKLREDDFQNFDPAEGAPRLVKACKSRGVSFFKILTSPEGAPLLERLVKSRIPAPNSQNPRSRISGSKNPQIPKIIGIGPESTKNGIDRLHPEPKIDFLGPGTAKTP